MEVSPELAERVLAWLRSDTFRPLKPRGLAKELQIVEDDYRELRRVIKYLAHRGQIQFGSNHVITRPETDDRVVQGTFRRAAGGFGFLRVQNLDGTRSLQEDLYVPQGFTQGAFDGDLVQVRLYPRRNGPGDDAHVTRIIERARRQFTGTFARHAGAAIVYLDGTPFDRPIAVGDVRGLPVNVDDKVVVELVKFPNDHGDGGEGVLLEVLGSSRNPAIDTITVMRQYGLSESYPEAAMIDARKQADQFDDSRVPEDRNDFTSLLTLTIDPADARDFDDAISLERNEVGNWLLYVHIADVAHFVPAGHPLDEEARRRATSVYLPDRVIPMLPEIISNHLASLQPERVRLTKTVRIELTDEGLPVHWDVVNSAIRSDIRLNYEQVDQFLADREAFVARWGQPICDLLGRMHTLAMKLRKRRMTRGSLELDLPEVKIDLDKGGKVSGAHLVVHTESHQIIEEFMLAANQAVATWLDDLALPFLHRIHPPPERRKLARLAKFAGDLRLPSGDYESRFGLQRLLKTTKGTPLEFAIHFAVLKAMSKAMYAPQVEPHYALDMEHYCHFTSPIRRYPDLTVHRLVQRLIEREPTPNDSFESLVTLGHHCSDQEQVAEQAERELIRIKLLHHLQKHLGETMEAMITNVNQDGFYARGVELPAEGFVPITSLPQDRYAYERRGQMLVGFREGNEFRLGDRVTVKVEKVDLRARELFFGLVKHHAVKHEKRSEHSSRPKPPSSTKKRGLRKKRRRS